MDDNCGEWVECMGVASGSGWNLWVWLLDVVLRRYVTVHAKTYRKSAKNIFEIRADFASSIYILDFLQNSFG